MAVRDCTARLLLSFGNSSMVVYTFCISKSMSGRS